MTITAAERKILQSEKDALLSEITAIKSERDTLIAQAASATTASQIDAVTDRIDSLTARVRQISARLNEINALLAQATFPPEEGPQYTVTNYVTNQVVQTTNAPSYGNPNAEVQAQVNSAYFSAGSSSPSVSTVATPAALVIAAAQGSSNISADQLNQLTTSMGGLNQMGQTPIMLSNMTAHAKNVLDQPTRVFDAINLTYRPEEVGTIGRCNSLGGFIGSIQGVFNGTLNAITSGLNQVTTALFSVPRAIIAGFTAATTALLGAITSGVQQAINTAISAVTTVTGGLFGALGEGVKSLVGAVGSAVNSVASAVQSEIANVANAINSMIQNPFRLIVPTVNPCVANIYKSSNPAANNWTYLTPTGQGMIMPNSTQATVPLTDAQAQLRRDAAAVTASIQEFNATF
jgi:hypothetical protein